MKREEKIEEILKIIKDKEIKFASLEFTEINGIVKSFGVNINRIESILKEGENFDGSSITGYGSIEESDMVALPDPFTFHIIPWNSQKKDECGFICDIYEPDGKRFEGDPRYILQNTYKEVQEMGYEFMCAPELEFFILSEEESIKPRDLRGYFDYDPHLIDEKMRRDMAEYAKGYGIEIETLHHEVAEGQNEIDFKYDTALKTADHTVWLKMIVKVVAAQYNCIASFMPKPFQNINGSGMHVHQSLWKNGENIFYDENDENHISQTMKYFVGGQIKYGREMCAVLCSWPNSYKRLVPGYEAPIYLAWGFKNRSPLIRVPSFPTKSGARCEIRCPDPAGNPYLQFSVLLATGLEGIKQKIEPPEPSDFNVYKISTKEMKKRGIKALPANLYEALEEYEKSELMKRVFGDRPFRNFLWAKLEEFDLYRKVVSNWEFDRYIKKL